MRTAVHAPDLEAPRWAVERARRDDPPERRAFSASSRANTGFTDPRLSWPRLGKAGPPGLSTRLLRRCRAGRRNGRARARPLREARLRPEADRPQLARG